MPDDGVADVQPHLPDLDGDVLDAEACPQHRVYQVPAIEESCHTCPPIRLSARSMAAGLHDQMAGVRVSLASGAWLFLVCDGIAGENLCIGRAMPNLSHAASIVLRCIP